MIIRLTLLDKQDVLHYSHEVPVAIINNKYESIGICRVFRDEETGKHFGELLLDYDVSEELFFYYRLAPNYAGIFILSGIDLAQIIAEGKPTIKLKAVKVDPE